MRDLDQSAEITAESQDGTTIPIQEITGIVVGTDADAHVTDFKLYLHSALFAYSIFLGSDGTAPNSGTIGGSNFYISNPTSEGVPFKIGDWTAGTLKNCIDGNMAVGHTSKVRFVDGVDFVVNVYDADDVSLLATHEITNISGNVGATTANGITLQVASFQADLNESAAVFTAIVNNDTILSSASGRLKVTFTIGTITYSPTPYFYDTDPNNATVPAAPTIGETGGSVVTRFLSGVEYYDTSSDFTVNANLNTPNGDTFRAGLLQIIGSEYGLATLNIDGSDLTGWTNLHDNTGDSYQKTDWEVQANFYTLTTTANISARGRDPWSDQGYQNSINASIAIDSYHAASTALVENFNEESWRCPSSANFDAGAAKSWTSSSDLLTSDALFQNSGCNHDVTDYTIYNPNPGSQPNYTGHSATQYLYRQFEHDGTASSSFDLTITGTYTSLEYKLAKAYDGTATGGTVWINALLNYDFNEWNNGSPTAGYGGNDGGTLTFGTNNIVNCSNTVYIKVGFTAGERITDLTVNFN